MKNNLPKQTTHTPQNKARPTGIDTPSGHDKTVSQALIKALLTAQTERVFDGNEKSSICNMVSAITTLAILNAPLVHILVTYAAHINSLQVIANPASRDYSLLNKYRFITRWEIRLNKEDTLTKLKALEDELIDFIGDAKDNLVGAV